MLEKNGLWLPRDALRPYNHNVSNFSISSTYLRVLTTAASATPILEDNDDAAGTDSESDEEIRETDQDRRKAMVDATQDADLDDFKYGFPDDFDFKLPGLREDQDDSLSNSHSAIDTGGPSGKDKILLQDEGTD